MCICLYDGRNRVIETAAFRMADFISLEDLRNRLRTMTS